MSDWKNRKLIEIRKFGETWLSVGQNISMIFQNWIIKGLPSSSFLKTLTTSDSSSANSSGSVGTYFFTHCTCGQSEWREITRLIHSDVL